MEVNQLDRYHLFSPSEVVSTQHTLAIHNFSFTLREVYKLLTFIQHLIVPVLHSFQARHDVLISCCPMPRELVLLNKHILPHHLQNSGIMQDHLAVSFSHHNDFLMSQADFINLPG